MKKRILALALVASMCVSLAACGNSGSNGAASKEDDKTITVAASPTPHAEILEVVKEILAAKGITLDIQVYNDYVVPNTVVDDGTVDANYFQHLPYLEDFNAENNTHIVSVSAIHVEPMGLYGGRQTSLDALKASK